MEGWYIKEGLMTCLGCRTIPFTARVFGSDLRGSTSRSDPDTKPPNNHQEWS